MKAIILAGGFGTRLRPITHEIPKPMIPIKGRPILEHNIDLLKKYDILNIIISIGYKGEKIREYFGDDSKFGAKITYVEEDKKTFRNCWTMRLAKKYLNNTFVMLNADNLFEIDLYDMYNFHKAHGGIATIALTTVSDPSSYGVTKMKGDRIIEFVEKPKREKAPSKIETEVFPKIAKIGKLYGYPFSGYWNDVGTLERYENAVKEWRGYDATS